MNALKTTTTTTAKVTKSAKAPKAAKKSLKLVKGGKKSERAILNDAYKKSKLAVQKRIKLNVTLPYLGRNAKLQGKRVKVVGYGGQGGIIVQAGARTLHVSPFALMKQAAAK